MEFIVSLKKTENGIILVVTDEEIVGQKFEEGKLQLDLTQKFYQGEKKSAEEVKKMILGVYILHLTGKKAVDLGLELKLINKEKVLKVKNIPHAEAVIENS